MLPVVVHLNWIPTYPSPEGELEDPAAAPHGVTGGWGGGTNSTNEREAGQKDPGK